jgi:hypothetical protein
VTGATASAAVVVAAGAVSLAGALAGTVAVSAGGWVTVAGASAAGAEVPVAAGAAPVVVDGAVGLDVPVPAGVVVVWVAGASLGAAAGAGWVAAGVWSAACELEVVDVPAGPSVGLGAVPAPLEDVLSRGPPDVVTAIIGAVGGPPPSTDAVVDVASGGG